MPYQILTPEGWKNILPEHKGDKPHEHGLERKVMIEKLQVTKAEDHMHKGKKEKK